MFNITSNYFSFLKNKPPAGWVVHITRDLITCYFCSYYSSMLRYILLIADDNLLQKELDSLAISLLPRKYPLDIITHNISKALLHSCKIIFREPTKKESGPRTIFSIVTPYPIEGKCFPQSVWIRWHIIENDPQLHNIWPNQPITTYH